MKFINTDGNAKINEANELTLYFNVKPMIYIFRITCYHNPKN